MSDTFRVGLDTFGDVTAAADNSLQSHASVLRDVLDEAVLADNLGLDARGSVPDRCPAAFVPGDRQEKREKREQDVFVFPSHDESLLLISRRAQPRR